MKFLYDANREDPDQLPHFNHTCLAISLKQLTPCSKFGNTMEPYFLHSGMGLIFKVTSVTTPRVPEIEGMYSLVSNSVDHEEMYMRQIILVFSACWQP